MINRLVKTAFPPKTANARKKLLTTKIRDSLHLQQWTIPTSGITCSTKKQWIAEKFLGNYQKIAPLPCKYSTFKVSFVGNTAA